MFNSSNYIPHRSSIFLNTKDNRISNRLFFCNAHDCMGESFAMYVRAYTHEEAAEHMIECWRTEGVIESPDDIDEDVILVYEVPSIEGETGVLNWDDFDCVVVPKDELF